MILKIVQNISVFGRFLKFLLSNHPKTNTESYSTPQDSTLDTPQGGVLDNFFWPHSVGPGNFKVVARWAVSTFGQFFFHFCFKMILESFSKKVGLVSHQYQFLDQANGGVVYVMVWGVVSLNDWLYAVRGFCKLFGFNMFELVKNFRNQ